MHVCISLPTIHTSCNIHQENFIIQIKIKTEKWKASVTITSLATASGAPGVDHLQKTSYWWTVFKTLAICRKIVPASSKATSPSLVPASQYATAPPLESSSSHPKDGKYAFPGCSKKLVVSNVIYKGTKQVSSHSNVFACATCIKFVPLQELRQNPPVTLCVL